MVKKSKPNIDGYYNELRHPATSRSAFRVEGYHEYFTIIDVATIKGGATFALLEGNISGEENTVVVQLPMSPRKVKIIRNYYGESFDVGLKEEVGFAFFIPNHLIIEDAYGNTLDEVLACNDYDTDDIQFWSQEEIDTKEN